GPGPALPYLSPEQLRGAPSGLATDVFALGVIAYRMTTGGWFPHQHVRTGHAELPPTELLHGQVSGAPFDPRERVPGLRAAWAEAIVAAIAADPSRRPASPRAFALGLAEARSVSAVSAAGANGRAIVRSGARERIDSTAAPGAAELGSRYQLGD